MRVEAPNEARPLDEWERLYKYVALAIAEQSVTVLRALLSGVSPAEQLRTYEQHVLRLRDELDLESDPTIAEPPL